MKNLHKLSSTILVLAVIILAGYVAILSEGRSAQTVENQGLRAQLSLEKNEREKLAETVKKYAKKVDDLTSEFEKNTESTQGTLELLDKKFAVVSSNTAELASHVIDGTGLWESSRGGVVRIVSAGSIGSGFISENHRVITACHVVTDKDFIAARFTDGSATPARVITCNAENDVAVLELVNPLLTKALPFADDFRIGQPVFLIGHQIADVFDTESPRMGIINAVYQEPWGKNFLNDGRNPRTLIQHDAMTNVGDSGAPLLNAQGKVIGMAVFRSARYANINFAIAAPVLRDIAAIP